MDILATLATNAFEYRATTAGVDRDAALPYVVALLAVVALAAAAATLESAVLAEGGSGFGSSGDTGVTSGSPDRPSGADTERLAPLEGGTPVSVCLPFLREPPALLALGLLFAVLFGAVYRSTRSVLAGSAACFTVGLPVGLLWALAAFCGNPDVRSMPERMATQGNGSFITTGEGGGSLGSGTAETVSSPSVLVGLLVVIAVVVVVASLVFFGDDDETAQASPENDEDRDEPAVAAVGRAAGAAADGIAADASTENEVYRAWRQMTNALEVDSPETTTPAEFAESAAAAGMARRDVRELTELFEAVRYGGFDPTDERERRAIETLRRIEDSYGETE